MRNNIDTQKKFEKYILRWGVVGIFGIKKFKLGVVGTIWLKKELTPIVRKLFKC